MECTVLVQSSNLYTVVCKNFLSFKYSTLDILFTPHHHHSSSTVHKFKFGRFLGRFLTKNRLISGLNRKSPKIHLKPEVNQKLVKLDKFKFGRFLVVFNKK